MSGVFYLGTEDLAPPAGKNLQKFYKKMFQLISDYFSNEEGGPYSKNVNWNSI